MDVSGTVFRLRLIVEDLDGLTGTLSLRGDTSARGIPLRNIEYDGNRLAFELNANPMNFEFLGALEGDMLEGDVLLMDQSGTFSLKRED